MKISNVGNEVLGTFKPSLCPVGYQSHGPLFARSGEERGEGAGWAQLAAVIIIQESIGPWDSLVSYQTDQSPSPRF